jgi:hypothetical protein
MSATAIARGAAAERTRLGPAWHRRVAGLHVVKLAGTPYEMGRQHGALLRDAIPRGPLPYYRAFPGRLLGKVGLGRGVAPVIARILAASVGRRVAASFPAEVRAAMRGLADGAGLRLAEVLEACAMPDTLLWLLAKAGNLDTGLRALARTAGMGCSSAVAWGAATTDGKLLHARNFDYHGTECWPREAAVIFHEPEQGLRYVSVVSAGILMGGVTAMNEAGLTLAMHEHTFHDATALGGTPAGVIGDRVMREARSIGEAEAILAAHRPNGSWTYVIADGRAREVLCHEESSARHASTRAGAPEATFRYANFFLDPELRRGERDTQGGYWRANEGRYERLGERLGGREGPLDPAAMAAILADTGDPRCRLRAPLAMLLTVGSVVFSPENGRFWVATGGAPVAHNAFEPFDLAREDHAPEHGRLAAHVPEDGAAVRAFEAYRQAFVAYFDRDDLAASGRALASARALAPGEPLYAFVAGLLELLTGAPREALASFERALAIGHPDPERVAATLLWRARALDLAGERGPAARGYEAALAAPRADPQVRRAARRGLSRAFSRAEARRLAIDFPHADAITP